MRRPTRRVNATPKKVLQLFDLPRELRLLWWHRPGGLGQVSRLHHPQESAQAIQGKTGNIENSIKIIHDSVVRLLRILHYKSQVFQPCSMRMKNLIHYDIIADIHGRFDKLTA
jgi:hypothetical protein